MHIDNVLYHYVIRSTSISKDKDLQTTLKSNERIATIAKTISPRVFAKAQASYLDVCLQYIEHPAAKRALRKHLHHNFSAFLKNQYISGKLKTIYCIRAAGITGSRSKKDNK